MLDLKVESHKIVDGVQRRFEIMIETRRHLRVAGLIPLTKVATSEVLLIEVGVLVLRDEVLQPPVDLLLVPRRRLRMSNCYIRKDA